MNPVLQAILDDPNDLTSRLVYADWLDENGDAARAEFIRVQCELADNPELACLRETELLAYRPKSWDGPAAQWCKPGDYEFRCGFVDRVKLPWHARYEHGDEMREALPIRIVEFTDRPLLMRGPVMQGTSLYKLVPLSLNPTAELSCGWVFLDYAFSGPHYDIVRPLLRERWPKIQRFLLPPIAQPML